MGEIHYVDEVLVKYRYHHNSTWNHSKGVDVDKDIAHERFWTFELGHVFKNWIADINKIKDVIPERKKEFEYLEGVTRDRLSLIEKENLIYSKNILKKILIIAAIFLKEKSLKGLRHRIGLFLVPNIYRKYLLLKYRRK